MTFAPTPLDPPNSAGEFQWGGVAGTHWWICPQANMAGVLMAQRQMGFWNPFFFEFKRLAYEAAGALITRPAHCSTKHHPVRTRAATAR